MRTKRAEIRDAFFRGDYRDAIELGRGRAPVRAKELPFLVGALSFDDRREEAERLFLDRRDSLPSIAKQACRFFLGVAFCRHGEYPRARAYFAANLVEGRRSRNRLARFYLWQGLGFYRYVCARFDLAKRASEEALAAATLDGFAYGIALASDLSGHALVQGGQLRAGLARLEEASRIAARNCDGGLAKSIRISLIVYRAQHGLQPSRAVPELREAFRRLDPQNGHAQSNLLLELANQLLLRGRLAEASLALDEASTRIYRSRHRRHANLLTLRLAELSYRSGRHASALNAVRGVRQVLDERHDRLLLLVALGLELKLLGVLGVEDGVAELRARLNHLTHLTGRGVSRAILSRESGALDSRPDREDRLGSFLDEIRGTRNLRLLVASGYWGSLHERLGVPRLSRTLVTRLAGGDLAALDQGEVTYVAKGVSSQLESLLHALAGGEKSKEALVQSLWGYAYHPLRHDQLVFQAVSRLRELLGSRGHWIESTATGYRLWPGVQVRAAGSAERSVAHAPASAHAFPRPTARLNTRQVEILELLTAHRFVGVPECLERFQVSDMTLRRDFQGLLKMGLVARRGRARATRYELRALAKR